MARARPVLKARPAFSGLATRGEWQQQRSVLGSVIFLLEINGEYITDNGEIPQQFHLYRHLGTF